MSAVAPAPGSDATIEARLLQALRDARLALDGGQLEEAAGLMQTANSLCEVAMRDPSSLSRSGLAEIQQLFASCLATGKPLHDQLVQRMAESGAVGKAAKAYQPRWRR
jgi:hypothetical protein